MPAVLSPRAASRVRAGAAASARTSRLRRAAPRRRTPQRRCDGRALVVMKPLTISLPPGATRRQSGQPRASACAPVRFASTRSTGAPGAAIVADEEPDRRRSRVQRRAASRGGDRVLVDVDADDVARAAQRRGHRQHAGAGADVEHASARRRRGRREPAGTAASSRDGRCRSPSTARSRSAARRRAPGSADVPRRRDDERPAVIAVSDRC